MYNILTPEPAVIALGVGVLAWLQYKYNVIVAAIAIYVAVVMSPYILFWVVIWWIRMLLKEKDGADINGGGYIYAPMKWPEYLKYKFTNGARKCR